MPNYTISIVEDEKILRDELAFQLQHHGFKVETFSDANSFYRFLAVNPNTIAVLDIGLEGEDGLSICQYLRAFNKQIGIVFVTARSLRDERLEGLEAGADAYLVKPVDVSELIMILRRVGERYCDAIRGGDASPTLPATHPALHWVFKLKNHVLISPQGIEISLTLSEFQLMSALVKKGDMFCSHLEFGLALGLHPDDLDKHRIEVILSRLRAKIERLTGTTLPLRSLRGVGYSLLEAKIREEK